MEVTIKFHDKIIEVRGVLDLERLDRLYKSVGVDEHWTVIAPSKEDIVDIREYAHPNQTNPLKQYSPPFFYSTC